MREIIVKFVGNGSLRIKSFVLFLVLTSSCERQKIETSLAQHESEVEWEQIDQFGQLHNEYLAKAVKDFDFSTSKPKAELFSRFKGMNIPGFMAESPDEEYFANQRKVFFDHLSLSGRAIVDRVSIAIADIQSVDEFNLFLARQKEDAVATTAGVEQTSILIYLTVVGSSAEFWLSPSQGGSGIGFDFLNKISIEARGSNLKCVSDVLEADGISAAGGFIVFAVSVALSSSVATGGISAAVIGAGLYAIAGESALASGYAGLKCLTQQ